jgi:uncharacterized DUF497 family protein
VLGFDWDDANLGHIARHGVTRAEAEELFAFPLLWMDAHTEDEELRLVEIGRTAAGRILKVVTTDRRGKIRVVTAFAPSPKETRDYLRAMLEQQ